MRNGRYLASFAPGFERHVAELLARSLGAVSKLSVSSGLAAFDYAGDLIDPEKLVFCNNLFLVLREWETSSLAFSSLVKMAADRSDARLWSTALAALSGGTFRVRFSRENQFESVDRRVTEQAERLVAAACRARPDRENPGAEFWFIRRRENVSYFAVRLTKKRAADKYLKPGELRPEVAELLTALARLTPDDRVLLDPFAGHGSIPDRLFRDRKGAVVYAVDSDPALASQIARRFSGNSRVRARAGNALNLDWIADGSVDAIVTDPPWGDWAGDTYRGERSIPALYRGMLAEFDRLLSARGRAVVLTGAKAEFELAVSESPFARSRDSEGFRTDILVNGKKCAAYVIAVEKGALNGEN